MNTSKHNIWMITLHEQWVKLFLAGKKRIELRTRVPKDLQFEDVIFVAQSGTHNRVVMKMTVESLIETSPDAMFYYYARQMQIDYKTYNDYTKGRDCVYGIRVNHVVKLKGDLHTSDFGIDKAPQWFRQVRM